MKKIYSILSIAVIALMGFAACTRDYTAGPMARNISLSPNAQQVAAEVQTFDVALTADGAWVATTPDWITVTPARGEGGETVKITVKPNDGAERSDAVKFYSAVGAVKNTDITLESTPLAELTVTQAAGEGHGGGEEQVISIADYLALGENTDPYIITGVITRIARTDFGNFDLTDETGTIYVYGLLTENLEAQKCFKEKELAMGDILTVKANNLQLYNGKTWEIVDAVYVSHSKSLIELAKDDEGNIIDNITLAKEGEDFEVKAIVKGENVKVDYDADWITFNGAAKDGENVTLNFTAAENSGVPRSAVMTISTSTSKGESSAVEFTVKQDGSILTVTVADFLAAEESEVVLYDLIGSISNINSTTYGNFDLVDETGSIYVYGLTATELGYGASNDKSFASLGLKEGDVIKIRGYRSSHNGNPQVKSAWFLEKLADGPKAVTVAEFLAAPESGTQVYELVGTIEGSINTTYGNFNLTDETGTVYVYGLTSTELGYGADNDKSFSSLGLKEGDKIKIKGYRGSFGEKIEVLNAWFIEKMSLGPIAATVAEFLAAPESSTQVYELVGTIEGSINTTYGNFNLTDETGTVYVYGLTSTELGYGADNDKSFSSLGLKEGDKIKIKGYRGSFGDKIEVLNAWFIEKLTSGEIPGESGSGITFTEAQLPMEYSYEETTFTQDGYECYIMTVANYGTGMQFRKEGGYMANKTAMDSDIKTITLTGHPDKKYYQNNLKVYAGSTEKPAGEALAGTLDESGKVETFAVPAGCTFFKIVNESGYAVYLASVKVAL